MASKRKISPKRKARSAPTQRWVVKAGSNMVCSGGPILLRAWMLQIAQLRAKSRIEVIWVTSGAIASAVERTRFSKRNRELADKQALSAIGQPLVMDLYNLALQTAGLLGAQVLLTYDDLAHVRRRRNFQNTIERLLSWGVVPILNENDAVATEEIRFGDNDSLSARVAKACNADRLIILTDVEGLFTANPKTDPKARLIPAVSVVTPEVLRKVGSKAGSSKGTGGMASKLLAARAAAQGGVPTTLARGDVPSVLIRIADGEQIGTHIGQLKKTGSR